MHTMYAIHTCIREGRFPKASHKTAKRSTQFSAQCVTGCADCALHTAEKQILMKVNECS